MKKDTDQWVKEGCRMKEVKFWWSFSCAMFLISAVAFYMAEMIKFAIIPGVLAVCWLSFGLGFMAGRKANKQ